MEDVAHANAKLTNREGGVPCHVIF